MASEDFLRKYICPNCHVAILRPHPTLHNYYKCPICAYTKEIKK